MATGKKKKPQQNHNTEVLCKYSNLFNTQIFSFSWNTFSPRYFPYIWLYRWKQEKVKKYNLLY